VIALACALLAVMLGLLNANAEGPWWITAASLLLAFLCILAAIWILMVWGLSRAGLW
jgi:flagellar biogenesis protein FliO